MTAFDSSRPPADGGSEDALLRSQQRLSLMLAATSEGLWEWDVETDEITWSDRTLSMLGYDRRSFAGNLAFVRGLVHPNDRETFERSLSEHTEGEAQGDLDLRLLRADGTYGIFRTRSMVLRGPDGEPRRRMGSIVDVTEVRRQARLLERAEAVGRIGGWELQAGSRQMYFSAETYRVLGVDPRTFAPTLEGVAALFPGDAQRSLVAAFEKGLAGGVAWDLELPRGMGSAATFVHITARADTELGATTRLFGTMQDVTERRLAEKAVLDSEQRFRGYFELSVVGLAITKPDKGIVEVNDHFCELLGYTRAEILRKTWAELTHHDDLRADVAEFQRVLAGEIDAYSIDKRFIRKSGEVLHAEIAVRCVRRKDGSVDYLLGLVRDVSERVQTLAALRESEARYRLLIENSRDLVMEVETDGRFVYASPNMKAELGLPPERLLRTSLLDYLHPEDRDRVRAQLQEPAACFKFRHAHAGGGHVWLEANASRFSTSAGAEHCVLICRNVTERIRIEKLSQESAELFTKAFGASPNSNSITDIETGEVLEVNEGFCSFFGYTREEAVGRTTGALGIWSDPGDRDRFVRELRRSGFVRDFLTKLRIRSGARRTCQVSAEIVRIGGRQRFIGVVVDVTERDEAERALRESEEKFAKAFHVGPHAMAILDLEANLFVDVNECFERLTGCARADVIGRQIGALGRMTPVERNRLLGALERDGIVQNMEAEFSHPDGAPGLALVSAEITELRGARHLLLSMQDISERRRMERAKAALEDQLRHVQKMEAIGTLAGGIAHDFNNILGAMLAYTEIAKLDAADNPAVRESLEEVRKAGGRAKDLVQQILTFSRRTSNERKPIHLQSIVAEALKLLSSTLPSTIRLVQDVDSEAGTVAADSTQLHQVLVNLCTNAAHALRGQPGEIVVRLAPWSPRDGERRNVPAARSGRYVELSVSDTGHGMDSLTLERIFEPFFTTKKPGDGTGLGLSVVHGIVEEHGGSIHVESEPGRGTTFHVLLPARGGVPESVVAATAGMPHGHGERILFIDDEPVLCAGAKKLLERLNYVVTTETSAPAAVTRFKADPSCFDLVLTDLTMPAMSGVDVAAELLRTRPDTPVVLATGFNANLTMEAVRTLGIRDLVTKPLSVEELAQTVHAALHPG